MATNKEINAKLKQINEKYRDRFAQAAEESWKNYVDNLPVGQAVPPKGRIYGNSARTSFDEFCRDLRGEASDLIGQARESVKEKMLEAPSADAVNVVNLLKLNEQATREEIGDILGKYGDNYLVSKTIGSIAHERGIIGLAGSSAALDQRMEELARIGKSYSAAAISVKGSEQRDPGAFTALIDADIDAVFPAE